VEIENFRCIRKAKIDLGPMTWRQRPRSGKSIQSPPIGKRPSASTASRSAAYGSRVVSAAYPGA